MFKRFFLSIPICLFSVVAFGQTSKTDSVRVHELKEVEVKAKNSKTHTSLPSQIITDDKIENLNANNVADIAKHFAGVTIKDYGGIGGLKTVSVRGLGATHTGVSYDGVVLSDIQSGQIDLSQFCSETISSVSLDNGQPNNLLQSARMLASSSVLSLNTKLFDYDSSHTLRGFATFKCGSFGFFKPSLMVQKYLSSKLAISIMGNGIIADGKYPFRLNINPYGKTIVENVRENTDVKSLNSEANLTYNFTSKEHLYFKSNHYYCDRGIPGSVVFYNYNDASGRVNDNNFLSQLCYENKNSVKWQYLLSGKYTQSGMQYTEIDQKYSTFKDNKRIDDNKQNEYYISAATQYRPFENLTISTALDYWYNNLFSKSNLNFRKDAQPTRQSVLANVSAKYVTEVLIIGGNILYSHSHETADSTFAAPDRSKLSPTIYASMKIIKDGSLILRAFYKNIFRMPNFTELYYHDFGFKDLLPEKTQQYNIGLTYSTSSVPFLNTLSATMDIYYNRISDKITIVYGMPFSTVRNIGIVKIKGCDVNLVALKEIGKNSKLELNANYTYQLAQNFENNPDTYGDIIPYTPIHSASASITYSYKKINLGYNLLFASKRYSGQNSDINNFLDPYSDHSLFGRYAYKQVSLIAEILNITNTNYSIVKYYPMPGRNYRFSINYKF